MKILTEKQLYQREWYIRNKERVKKKSKAWKRRNKDSIRKSSKAWVANNKEATKKYSRSWCERNRERCKKNRQNWEQNNHNRRILIDKNWKTSNPFKVCLYQMRRRAKELNVEFNLTDEYLKKIWTGTCPVFNTQILINVGN